MTKTALFASAAALALTVSGTAFAAGHTAHPATSVKASTNAVHFPSNAAGTLYDQTKDTLGSYEVSDDFDSGSFDSYDNQGADDFTVPSGATWHVTEVDATGAYFNSGGLTSGSIDGVNVFFYTNKKGKPGKAAKNGTFMNASVTDDGNGNLTIKLGKKGVKLGAGTYWVSVQAQDNFTATGAEWGWGDSEVQHGSAAMWQNPGNGFGLNCTTWGTLAACLGSGGPDFSFRLAGKSK